MTEVAGPTLTPESVLPGVNQQKMDGSLFVMEACSIEEVKAFVEDDIYYRNNVVSLLASGFSLRIPLT